MVDEDGELHGETIDLIRRVFASQQVEVRFNPVDGPMAQAVHVAAGRADAAADFSITDRRRRWYRVSHYYATEELQTFTLPHGPLWGGFEHFHGVLGVKAESYAQEYFIRNYRWIPLFLAATTADLLDALRRRRVRAIILARRSGLALAEVEQEVGLQARGSPFGPTLLALAALPEREDMIEAFNAGLARYGH